MRETGPVRWRTEGDQETVDSHAGLARTLLGALKQEMESFGAQQLERSRTLEDGTVITVASRFGQDEIQISAPLAAQAEEEIASGAITEQAQFKYYYSPAIANPCVCRTISLGILRDGINLLPVITSFVAGIDTAGVPYNETDVTYNVFHDGVLLESYTGSNIAAHDTNPTGGGGAHFFVQSWSNFPSLSPKFGTIDPNLVGYTTTGTYNLNQINHVETPFPADSQYVGFGSAIEVKRSVYFSDGTEQGSWPVNHVTLLPNVKSTFWSGGGYVELTDGTTVLFSVPSDACYPAGSDTPPGGVNAAAWTAARADATVRERARRKTCSDNLAANVAAGAADSLAQYFHSGHPVTTGAHMQAAMSVQITNSSVGSGDDVTSIRTIVLTFASETGSQSQTISGNKRVKVTRGVDSTGLANVVIFTTTTYTNWLNMTDASGFTTSPLRFTFVPIPPGFGLCEMWNGNVVAGAASPADTFDSNGGLFTIGAAAPAPRPLSSSGIAATYPDIYLAYRAQVPRQFKPKEAGDISWLDSTIGSGEHIEVILLRVIHADFGDLGMFPQAKDIADATKLKLVFDTVSTYRYRYSDGSFTLSKLRAVADKHGGAAKVELAYQAGINAVFISRDLPWPDLEGVFNGATKRYSSGSYLWQMQRVDPRGPVPTTELTTAELLFRAIEQARVDGFKF